MYWNEFWAAQKGTQFKSKSPSLKQKRYRLTHARFSFFFCPAVKGLSRGTYTSWRRDPTSHERIRIFWHQRYGGQMVGWLCWGLTSQSTIFQSCRDGAIASWVSNQYFRGVKCLAQGHNTAAVGLEPRTSRSGVRHSTTEPPRSPGGQMDPDWSCEGRPTYCSGRDLS